MIIEMNQYEETPAKETILALLIWHNGDLAMICDPVAKGTRTIRQPT